MSIYRLSKNNWFSKGIILTLILTVIIISSCSNLNEDVNYNSNESDQSNQDIQKLSFAEFCETYQFTEYENMFIYQSDVAFSKEYVQALYKNSIAAKNSSTIQRATIAVDPVSGERWVWSDTEKNNLTFSFTTNMATSHLTDQQVKDAFREAVLEWMKAADITITEQTTGGMIDIKTIDTVLEEYNARSFYPHSSYEYSITLNLYYAENKYNTYEKMVGLWIHEIGHALGLFHENIRMNGSPYGEAHGEIDTASVMNYNNSPYLSGISQGDIAAVAYLYGPSKIGNETIDLSPTDINWSYGELKAGTTLVFESGITNSGNTESGNFNIKWYVNNNQVSWGGHNSIPADTTVMNGNSFLIWTPDQPGNYELKFVVDSESMLAETDESNNTVIYNVTITDDTNTTVLTNEDNNKTWTVNGEKTFSLTSGNSGTIQFNHDWMANVQYSVNGSTSLPTPENWGGAITAAPNTNIILKIKTLEQRDIVISWW